MVAVISNGTAILGLGNPSGEPSDRVMRSVELMEERGVDFEFEGEMPPDVAIDPALWANYPLQRLTAPANVLIMSAIHSASISTKLIEAWAARPSSVRWCSACRGQSRSVSCRIRCRRSSPWRHSPHTTCARWSTAKAIYAARIEQTANKESPALGDGAGLFVTSDNACAPYQRRSS